SPLDLCKDEGICKPEDSRTFTVEPAGFSSIHNDLKVAIKDLVLTIVGPAGAKWDDVDKDGKIGTQKDGIFSNSNVSDDGLTLTLDGGTIPTSTSFKPLFNTDPKEGANVRVKASISVVPEPSTLLLFSSCLAGLGGLAWRRRRRAQRFLEAIPEKS